jgi:hypothetical protein
METVCAALRNVDDGGTKRPREGALQRSSVAANERSSAFRFHVS